MNAAPCCPFDVRYICGFTSRAHIAALLIALTNRPCAPNPAVQSTMFALCAHVYPAAVRATGTASALAFGRFGAILSALSLGILG